MFRRTKRGTKTQGRAACDARARLITGCANGVESERNHSFLSVVAVASNLVREVGA